MHGNTVIREVLYKPKSWNALYKAGASASCDNMINENGDV